MCNMPGKQLGEASGWAQTRDACASVLPSFNRLPPSVPLHVWAPERGEAAKGLLFGVKEATAMHGVICCP